MNNTILYTSELACVQKSQFTFSVALRDPIPRGCQLKSVPLFPGVVLLSWLNRFWLSSLLPGCLWVSVWRLRDTVEG